MRIIKKYSNRRLYDTSTSSYINLENLAAIIHNGESVQVLDARSGDDLTRTILFQILLDSNNTLELMPTRLLHRMIRMSAPSRPMVAVFQKQLAAGFQMLDNQFSALEKQFQWLTPPAPTPAPPPSNPEPDTSTMEELDILRERLAALEAQLKKE